MRIVVASDSFKGSLSSAQVAAAAKKGILSIYPDAEVVEVNVADGGEGTVEAITGSLGGQLRSIEVKGPLGDPVTATYGIAGKVAVMEMAAASGLTLIPQDKRNPMKTSTFGTGQMIQDALAQGCREFLVGIGGSATNDAGTGMLQALGFRFVDETGHELESCGESMAKIRKIETDSVLPELSESSFTVACDVDTPFCGPDGAAPVFAPQKGATPEMVSMLDSGMASLAKVIDDTFHCGDISRVAGTGAAGGLGGGFKACLGARLVKGIDMVLDAIHFDDIIKGADLVITGEGSIDFQTAKGKTAAGVLSRCKAQGIPVYAIGGRVVDCKEVNSMGFARTEAVSDPSVPLSISMQSEVASENVTRTVSAMMAD